MVYRELQITLLLAIQPDFRAHPSMRLRPRNKSKLNNSGIAYDLVVDLMARLDSFTGLRKAWSMILSGSTYECSKVQSIDSYRCGDHFLHGVNGFRSK
jgi:hypothetical protein